MDCKTILSPVTELAEYDDILGCTAERRTAAVVCPADGAKLALAAALSLQASVTLVVTYSETRARDLVARYRFYDSNTLYFPAKDMIFYEADVMAGEVTMNRIRVLRALAEATEDAERHCAVVTTFAALMNPQVLWDSADVLPLAKGDSVNLADVSARLVSMGYTKEFQTSAPGQFATHGGILDIYDETCDNPYRIELWGDDIESIRSFDAESQRSLETLDSITVYPAAEFVIGRKQLAQGFERIDAQTAQQIDKLRNAYSTAEAGRLRGVIDELRERAVELGDIRSLAGYVPYFYEEGQLRSLVELLPLDAAIFLDEPARCEEQATAVEAEWRESMSNRIEKGYTLPGAAGLLIPGSSVAASIAGRGAVLLGTLDTKNGLIAPNRHFDVAARNINSYNNSFPSLVKDLSRYKSERWRTVLLAASRTGGKRLAADLASEGISAVYSEDPDRPLVAGEVLVTYGSCGGGFEFPMLRYAVISESDVFGRDSKRKAAKSQYHGTKVKDFADLSVGDYVVHESHGLGIYKGIESLKSADGQQRDYIKVEYADGGILYVLATGLEVIQKYASADSKPPKLNKLGTKQWEQTKSKVRSAVDEVADDLVSLYAARQAASGYQYGPDTVWQSEFEELFPYEETDDQLAAIADTKADMESGKVMDRLICGDVGYGKTEVAIRAAFKAVQEGKQVVMLAPTTILVQQHYNTFTERMKTFPVKIEMLSRLRNAAEQRAVLRDLAAGAVDIVIGTHRLLSDDVRFHDLGLLIVDEEQRFGVSHKEKIKKLRENVDVLTLTATPIPRTMHMSLVGIRDMSVLEQAPQDRLPIQTFVCEYSEEMVREAASRELARGGQVYYVYNRINNIADVAARLQLQIPDANIAYAHGQMPPAQLESIMFDFVNGDIDVLVSTTIIETGLDIPNVNTIIVADSDRYGLAQLYQLRGRVGRSSRTAYAFLMYRRDRMLSEVAEKRLAAIKEFTELGSGMRIAMRDLEIRGAGNLLGRAQSGHMAAVGYDLYCKMLGDAVAMKKGGPVQAHYDTAVELDCDAYLPSDYILNEQQKLDIYKRIASLSGTAQRNDMEDELKDRFGEIPRPAANLLRISLIKETAHELQITEVKSSAGQLVMKFRKDAVLNPSGIPGLLQSYRGLLQFTAGNPAAFSYKLRRSGVPEIDEENLLHAAEFLLGQMKAIFCTQ